MDDPSLAAELALALQLADLADAETLPRYEHRTFTVERKADRTEVTEAELIAYCRERLAGYKCPSSVDWVEVLPRNPSGKILKKDLRKPYWEGRDRMVG